MTIGKILSIVVAVFVSIFVITGIGAVVETLDATEIMVIQDAWDGELHWHTTQGIKAQWWGKVTKYQKRAQYWFSAKEGAGTPVHIRFNDGGNADISGSIAWEMPQDVKTLTELHSRYGNQHAVDEQLIRTIVDKAVYFSGPIMSSKESYSEKRNDLIRLIQDQVNHGVYQTQSIQVKEKDALSGQEKTVTVASIVLDKDGNPKRQESSPLEEFGIKAFNLSINSVTYDKTVETQIQAQQAAIMQVQTAMAEAKKAEQAAITAEKNGEAKAAEAKWEQEVIKAKEVTAAQQRLEVSRLDTQSAEQQKKKLILEGEGEAEKRRLVMSADGALDKKGQLWLESQKVWATAFANSKVPLVPNIVFGQGTGGNSLNNVESLMSVLGAKAAKDLALDLDARK